MPTDNTNILGLSKYQLEYDQDKENSGVLDPIQVNKMEKSKYQLELDQDNLQTKLKSGQDISYADTSWGKAILKTVDNFSFLEYFGTVPETAKNLFVSLKNYKVTGPALKKAATTYANTMTAQLTSRITGVPIDKEKFINSEDKDFQDVGRFLNWEDEMKNQYGTEAGIKKYMIENPEQAFIDLQTLLVPAAKVAGLSKTAKVLSLFDPLNAAVQGIKQPASLIAKYTPKLKNIPTSLYERAIKLSDDIPEAKRKRLVEISMDNGVELVYKEHERLSKQIDEIDRITNDAISSIDPINTMSRADLKKGLSDFKKKILSTSLDANGKKAIDDVIKTIDKYNDELNRTNLTPMEDQAMKVRLNKELSDSYIKGTNSIKATPISNEAKMIVNRNLREFLEVMLPDISIPAANTPLTNALIQKRFPGAKNLSLKELNRLEGDIIEIRHAVADESYKLTIGSFFDFQVGQKTATFAFAGGAAARAVTSDVTAISSTMAVTGGAGFIVGLIDSSPLIKSKVANYIHNLQSLGLNIKPNAAMIRLGLYQIEGRDKKESEWRQGK